MLHLVSELQFLVKLNQSLKKPHDHMELLIHTNVKTKACFGKVLSVIYVTNDQISLPQ